MCGTCSASSFVPFGQVSVTLAKANVIPLRMQRGHYPVPSPRQSGERVWVRGNLDGESIAAQPLTPDLSPRFRGEGAVITPIPEYLER